MIQSKHSPARHFPVPECRCAICNPQPGADPHPKYGYDRNQVPGIQCLLCGKPIGHEEYIEVTTLARFGQMAFMHKRCAEETGR